jgi:hypothetical protein
MIEILLLDIINDGACAIRSVEDNDLFARRSSRARSFRRDADHPEIDGSNPARRLGVDGRQRRERPSCR